jgi:hypothetical protein
MSNQGTPGCPASHARGCLEFLNPWHKSRCRLASEACEEILGKGYFPLDISLSHSTRMNCGSYYMVVIVVQLLLEVGIKLAPEPGCCNFHI